MIEIERIYIYRKMSSIPHLTLPLLELFVWNSKALRITCDQRVYSDDRVSVILMFCVVLDADVTCHSYSACNTIYYHNILLLQ